jgi:hypothetical protein
METQVRLLQNMVDHIMSRALIDQVYVSATSYASIAFCDRDKNNKYGEIISQLNNVEGNTQDSRD